MPTLTDAKARSLRCAPDKKSLIVADVPGLFLVVRLSGKKSWRVRFQHLGEERKTRLGEFPSMGVADARAALISFRESVEKGFSTHVGITLDRLFDDWWEKWSPLKADRTTFYARSRYKAQVSPSLGKRMIADLRATHFIDLALALEKTDRPEVARRVFALCRQILARGVVRGWLTHNVLAGLRETDVFKATEEVNFARLNHGEMPGFFRALEIYEGSTRVRVATKLLAHTFVRTHELIHAQWSHIDISSARWNVPELLVKTRRPHVVPLSRHALELLRQLHEANERKYGPTGIEPDAYLFPGDRDRHKPISNNTILKVIESIGYKHKMTGHGFRGVASTALNEAGFRSDVIEIQLAHVQDKVRGAYNHAQYLPERRAMMQAWSDCIERMTKTGVASLPMAT
jgi:integrase